MSSALVRLRARYSCQLASLAAAVQAQRASEASRLAGLEDTVSALKLRVAALEGSLATCEANLSKERSAGATLRQRLASINTELEVAKASHHSTAENASAATAQVTDLSRKLGEASEEVCKLGVCVCACVCFICFPMRPQLVKTNLALTEALAELKDTSAKYTLLQTESAARIDTLNARVRKAEASAEEESNQNAALVAKLSTVENQVRELCVLRLSREGLVQRRFCAGAGAADGTCPCASGERHCARAGQVFPIRAAVASVRRVRSEARP